MKRRVKLVIGCIVFIVLAALALFVMNRRHQRH